jgi:hypothetical protein
VALHAAPRRPFLPPQDLADAEPVDPAGPHLRLVGQVNVDLVLLGVDEDADVRDVLRPRLLAGEDQHPRALRDGGGHERLDGAKTEGDVEVRAPCVLGFPEPGIAVLRAAGQPRAPPFRERAVLAVEAVAVVAELPADAVLERLAGPDDAVVQGLVGLDGVRARRGGGHRAG